ncbi:hypothetical protein A2291_00715 [candidate division WOR-1 bacterium RIFOXYB2_FULL_42_35]|uniref:histidine kinase n=1 Tax=candidate division WOR-1 bacterium RIFOXYC2_FULL_41_25 TaxID=1802586 RepID=A0A1F4TRN2_UNCSA|nr:MAG: hypothetical protein A2247_07940 [candidate division WOR-1 bacterium RIFOXYA2_FULL_41_14]OGC25749.1 MAG: hypothetical protein A2291_00715 [candidate division WOR-1 bacterium RIFOXYB2_FULL_42_35]OGC35351.1 MAG: hypothetical protein A2462_07010 [candidate division WOR-1 bacterium RIFOXYC2_FULL_41_25]
MLSTLTIISIFTEIFACGFLVTGAVIFLKKYFSEKKIKSLFFSLFFLALFFNVAAGISSQLMFNLGSGLSRLILVYKSISITTVLSALFLWGFVLERFNLKKIRWSFVLLLLLAVFFIVRILNSSVNLVYREGIIEPIVDLSLYVPVKPLLAFVWILLALFSFTTSFSNQKGSNVLARYLGSSALFFLLAMFSTFLYVRFGEAGFLLASWILILLFSLACLLAELISPDSAEAASPLTFFRTRILFKLMLIFVLLIVILFETTTLATINISKTALSKEIVNSYNKQAERLVTEINKFPDQPTFADLQEIISPSNVEGKAIAFVIDSKGSLLAHPDKIRSLQHEVLGKDQAVKFLLAGQKGAGEFRDELGRLNVGAYLPVPKYNWGIVVAEPMESAYFEMRKVETSSLLFVIAGIILTALVGIFFARSIEKPIKELTVGTEAVAKGQLHWKSNIDSGDEIGRLAGAFNLMTDELRDSQARLVLSEKLSSLGTMAAGMAHEIKNPLVSLRTFTQLLIQKWDDQEFREKFASIIPQEIERINRIAESLLKFGKPMKPEHKAVDINGLLDEVLMLFESETKKNNVRVTKKLAELPPLVGDAGQLQQAFVNIIKNAIESMNDKGGELVVKSDIGEVVHLGQTSKEGKKVGDEMVWGEGDETAKPVPVIFLEISDSGEGIPEDNIRTLFDPFFTTKMTGTGMGLPITLRIIEEHNGSIKVRSAANKGTTFIITLPYGQQKED